MTTDWNLIAHPMVPVWLIGALLALTALLTAFALYHRRPGAWLRAAAMALLVLCLADPALRLEERQSQPTVIALVVDESASQDIAGRTAMAQQAAEALRPQIQALGPLDIRTISLGADRDLGTPAFGPIQAALADVPPEQLGGVLILSDGQIVDQPLPQRNVPIHALLTGHNGEGDRRIVLHWL